MSAFQQALQDAQIKNGKLLEELRGTEYASTALKQNLDYIADLKSQIASADEELQELSKITQDERKDHLRYQDSIMKRYAFKLSAQTEKFHSKQQKEEREFLEAYQWEREAQKYKESLMSALERAEGEKRAQEADVARHDNAQVELHRTYNVIFHGTTPYVPGEDDMEQAAKNARDWLQRCETQFGNKHRVLEDLETARKWLHSALSDMDSACGHSQVEMSGGGTFPDLMERSALARAQNNLTQCLRSMNEARRFEPAIPQLRGITIGHGCMISDFVFDDILYNTAQKERTKDSRAQMVVARDHLESIRREQLQPVQDAIHPLMQASTELEEARTQLQRTRSEAFERFAGPGSGDTLTDWG